MSAAKQVFKIQPLTSSEIKYLQSLLPVIKDKGVDVTSTMYQYMFKTYPNVRPYFNMTNQFTKRQPKVLAFSLYAYISNLSDLTPINGFVEQIVVKHCGLNIKPDQYVIVGTSLVHAFKEILADAADEKFVNTLTKAYGNLAQTLINAEEKYYQGLQWRDAKKFKVTRLVKECSNVTSVYATPIDGTVLEDVVPGQYLGIRWKVPGKEEESREYSISKYVDHNEYRISVRLIENGKISTFVNKELKAGDVLDIHAPVGTFVYDKDSANEKVAVFAGGIGITPLITITETALKNGKEVEFYYSNQSKETEPFEDWVKELSQEYPSKFRASEYFSKEGHKIQTKDFDHINDKYDVYLLGPVGYMNFVKSFLQEKGVDKINLEYFGPIVV